MAKKTEYTVEGYGADPDEGYGGPYLKDAFFDPKEAFKNGGGNSVPRKKTAPTPKKA